MVSARRCGYDICFLHPKANEQFPIAGEGVLIELVQAPPEVVKAFSQLATQGKAGNRFSQRPQKGPSRAFCMDTGHFGVFRVPGAMAMVDVLDLVVARQAQVWMSWRRCAQWHWRCALRFRRSGAHCA